MPRKTFEQFVATLKKTNIVPSYYYTDYQRVQSHIDRFRHILDQIGTINSSTEFIERFTTIYNNDNNAIECIPLFTGVRPDKLIVINDSGDSIEKFNKDYIQLQEGIEFLSNVGFLERIDEMAPFDAKSYFFGVNVGLDSNGRKNRGGKQMEQLVGTYVKQVFEPSNIIEQATVDKMNKIWDLKIVNPIAKKKKFDFALKASNTILLLEVNFFNSSGSKTDINTRFIRLQETTRRMNYNNINFIFGVITDGQGLIKAMDEIRDVFNQIECVKNIDDLQNGWLEEFKTSIDEA